MNKQLPTEEEADKPQKLPIGKFGMDLTWLQDEKLSEEE